MNNTSPNSTPAQSLKSLAGPWDESAKLTALSVASTGLSVAFVIALFGGLDAFDSTLICTLFVLLMVATAFAAQWHGIKLLRSRVKNWKAMLGSTGLLVTILLLSYFGVVSNFVSPEYRNAKLFLGGVAESFWNVALCLTLLCTIWGQAWNRFKQARQALCKKLDVLFLAFVLTSFTLIFFSFYAFGDAGDSIYARGTSVVIGALSICYLLRLAAKLKRGVSIPCSEIASSLLTILVCLWDAVLECYGLAVLYNAFL